MKVRPLGDRIVVRRQDAESKTAGGILLPDAAKDKPQKGKVLAIGAGKLHKDGSRKGVQVKTAITSSSPPGPAMNTKKAPAATSSSCARKTSSPSSMSNPVFVWRSQRAARALTVNC